MAQWENREEYEKWKSERLKQSDSSPGKPEVIEEPGNESDIKNKQRKLTKIKLFVLIFAAILIVVYIFNSPDNSKTSNKIPRINQKTKKMAANVIENYPLVIDTAIKQEGRDISLVIVVNGSISKQRAKELGDNFVRLIKTFSKDKVPGEKIGDGIYNYLIGVYDPEENNIVLGTKVYTAEQITW